MPQRTRDVPGPARLVHTIYTNELNPHSNSVKQILYSVLNRYDLI